MPDATPKVVRRRGWYRMLVQLVLSLGRRGYAVAIIAVTAWLSYLALRYLVVTLMFPTPTPRQITGIPKRLSEAVLRTRRSAWLGEETSANPRTPLAHYHRLNGWIQPDQFNDCTRSGCHAPLPHSKHKEVRAFLNMHATSLHCSVCHLKSDDRPLMTVWYDLTSGRTRGAPTVLEAYAWLMSDEGQKALAAPTAAEQDRLVSLLRTAAQETDNEPALTQLAEHVAAVRYSSSEFPDLVEEARAILPRHFRGEYGAKLALRDPKGGGPLLGHPGTAEAVREFMAVKFDSLDPAQRAALVAKLHPLKRDQALHCTDCHRAEGGLLDFVRAGYPEARRQALFRQPVFQMIEHIAAGQPMHLPQFIAPSSPAGTPTTAPTSQP